MLTGSPISMAAPGDSQDSLVERLGLRIEVDVLPALTLGRGLGEEGARSSMPARPSASRAGSSRSVRPTISSSLRMPSEARTSRTSSASMQ